MMLFFTLPLLPELMFRSGLASLMFPWLMARFEPGAVYRRFDGMEGDAIRYLGIYRANLLQRTLLPRRQPPSPVPVHVLMSRRDPFLPPAVFEDSGSWYPLALNVPTKPGSDELMSALQPPVVCVG